MACGCKDIGRCKACGVVELDITAAQDGVISLVIQSPNHMTLAQAEPGTANKIQIDASKLKEGQVYEIRGWYANGVKVRSEDGHECFQFTTVLT